MSDANVRGWEAVSLRQLFYFCQKRWRRTTNSKHMVNAYFSLAFYCVLECWRCGDECTLLSRALSAAKHNCIPLSIHAIPFLND